MEDNRVLLLEQEFHNYKEINDREILKIQKELEDHEKRILSMERSKEKTDFQYDQIMETLNKLNNITIPNLTAQIEELKNKPIKRYDQVIGSILGAIFGAIGGAIAGVLLKS